MGDVRKAARIEQRHAGGAAGAPVFGDAVRRLQTKRGVEVAVGQGAQHVLVEDRDLLPLRRVVEPLGIDMIELTLVERRAARLGERVEFSLPLNGLDLGATFR